MKLGFTAFAMLMLTTGIKSQSILGFQNGTIITSTHDTINCLVPIASSFGEEIETKKDRDSGVQTIKLENIKYLITDYNVYEHIIFKQKDEEIHRLMWWKIEGKLGLYLEVVSATMGTTHKEGNLTITRMRQPGKTYVIKKAGSFYLIREKKEFISSITPLISEYPELVAKVEAKKYNYDNIEELVTEYNQLAAMQ